MFSRRRAVSGIWRNFCSHCTSAAECSGVYPRSETWPPSKPKAVLAIKVRDEKIFFMGQGPLFKACESTGNLRSCLRKMDPHLGDRVEEFDLGTAGSIHAVTF